MSFHVDYWNYLGWTDPYSKKAFSTRQRLYANALSSGVYTPQMVFNGKEETVGSNRYKVNAAISKSTGKQSKEDVKLRLANMDSKASLRVDYTVEGKPKRQTDQYRPC